MVESSSRLEWLQSHVNLEGLGEVGSNQLSRNNRDQIKGNNLFTTD